MKTEDFGELLRLREVYSFSQVPPGRFAILRVDGRGFTSHTAQAGYVKPFDGKFSSHMVRCARRLLAGFDGVYATTHSDEISVVMHPRSELFHRRAEKLASLAAGTVSAEFGQAFDGRVSLAHGVGEVVDYFSWRQADAVSNGLSSWAYWTLRNGGLSAAAATDRLKGASSAERRQILAVAGVDFDTVPLWTRRGLDLSWRRQEKPGFNPKTQEHVVAMRTFTDVRAELPAGDEYRAWLLDYLTKEISA